jgi:hypothetical protein
MEVSRRLLEGDGRGGRDGRDAAAAAHGKVSDGRRKRGRWERK